MTDADLLLDLPDPEFGSGVIGVCDVCGKRQAVIVLSKERFKLCVIDFLNKKWADSPATPGAPLPPYRSERVWVPSREAPGGKTSAILLSPTKPVRRPGVLVTPEIYGLTTATLDAAVRLAREGFEVLMPELSRTGALGPLDHLAMRVGRLGRGGIPSNSPSMERLTRINADALEMLRGGALVDAGRTAVVGLSYGGSLAALLAVRDQRLGAVALAYPMPVAPRGLLGLITAPTFVLLGRRDRAARAAADDLARGRPPEAVVRFDAGAVRHGFLARDLRAYRLTEAEVAWSALLAFLRGRLMPPPPKPPAPPVVVASSSALPAAATSASGALPPTAPRAVA